MQACQLKKLNVLERRHGPPCERPNDWGPIQIIFQCSFQGFRAAELVFMLGGYIE